MRSMPKALELGGKDEGQAGSRGGSGFLRGLFPRPRWQQTECLLQPG